MQDLIPTLYKFLPNWLPETGDMNKDKKAQDRARDAYSNAVYKNQTVYDIQLKCISLIRQIDISKLLAMNDVILPIIVDEYVELYKNFNIVKKLLTNIKVQVPNIAIIDGQLKVSMLKQNLWDDLNFLQSKNISFDIKEYMELYSSKIKLV